MVAICGPLLKVVSGLYCKMLLAGIYNAVDFSAEKSFQWKQLSCGCSAHVGYFWSLTRQNLQSSISLCIWYVFHKQLCTTAKLMELIIYFRSHCLFAWCSDGGIKLIPCAKAHCEIYTALLSPLSLIFGLTGDLRHVCTEEWPAWNQWTELHALGKAFVSFLLKKH